LKDDTGAPGAISSAEYNGIYVLEEKIKRDKNRVDIAKLEPEHTNAPAITGGYMLSIDRSNGETPLSTTAEVSTGLSRTLTHDQHLASAPTQLYPNLLQ